MRCSPSYAATPAPTAPSRPPSSPPATGSTRRPALRELERDGTLVRGELLPGGSEREWCDADVLRRVRRASLAHLRREVEPAGRDRFARFLPSWQNVDAHRAAGAGPDRLREALVPLQGVALTPKVWEADVLPRRLGAYSPAWLDELCTSGEVVWIGAGARGRSDGRIALYFRDDVRLAGPPPANAKLERPAGEVHDAIRERLAAGPDFWLDLLADLGTPGRGAARGALGPGLGGRGDQRRLLAAARPAPARRAAARAARSPLRPPPRPRPGRPGPLVADRALFEDGPAAGPRLRAQAELMMERYGIVTRETVLAEGIPGGFAGIYAELGNLEMLGTARRGYFVEGLGGAQFALPGAVERLRSLPEDDGSFLLLAATDPANPYGAALPWPKPPSGRRPSRTPGAHVLMRDGAPVLYVERSGKRDRPPGRARRGGAGRGGRRPRRGRRRRTPAEAGGREARRRAGDRLGPRGRPARGRFQPRPAQADPGGALSTLP